MPSRFQMMKCAASELFTTSTAWMLLASSWPMRWKMRSPPERSTRTAMPGYLASNALAMRSATGRSTAVYHTALPSLVAAATSSGVTADGAGAADDEGGDKATVAPSAAAPCIRLRRVRFDWGIRILPSVDVRPSGSGLFTRHPGRSVQAEGGQRSEPGPREIPLARPHPG